MFYVLVTLWVALVIAAGFLVGWPIVGAGYGIAIAIGGPFFLWLGWGMHTYSEKPQSRRW